MKELLCHHWQAGKTKINFGEALIPSIINFFGYRYIPDLPIHSSCYKIKLMTLGSQFNYDYVNSINKNHKIVVWGSGYSEGRIPFLNDPKIDIRAVRGYKTKELIGKDVPVGDPGFLISEIIPNFHQPSGIETWAPHWHNRNNSGWSNTKFFNVETRVSHIAKFIDILCKSSFVYTSSLHICIACISYGIPFAMCLQDGDSINKPFKWHDAFSLLNVEPCWCRSKREAHSWWEDYGSHIKIPCMDNFKKSFPRDISNYRIFL